jgi:hypothetical protein
VEIVRTHLFKEEKLSVVYAFLVVRPETKGQPEIVVLENGKDIEGRNLKYYSNAISHRLKDTLSYGIFWKPVAGSLHGLNRVYLSADGVYNQISLNTLFNPETGKYLMDELQIRLVGSTRDLASAPASGLSKIKSATLFGYPDYNRTAQTSSVTGASLPALRGDSSVRFFSGSEISELPGTKKEIETIEALLKASGVNLQPYLFDQATEERVKEQRNPQVLHVATHGYFLSDLTSFDAGDRAFAGIQSATIRENPLLRSGLLFAGARDAFRNRPVEGDDGVLTAYEASTLELDHTDLVVMSACETGLGVTANGEGVYGLQRAFQSAGARSVIMSLWKVSDEATRDLMIAFYRNWLSGKSTADSFREAQISLRAKYQEPYFWGAFVMSGN